MTGTVSSTSRAPASSDPLLRPSVSTYWEWLLSPRLAIVSALGLVRIAVHGDSVLVGVAMLLGILAVAALVVLAHARVSKVWATSEAVFHRNMLGRVRTATRAEVAHTLLALRYKNVNPGNDPAVLLAFLDHKGRAALRVQGPSWRATAVQDFVEAADFRPLLLIEADTSARELRGSHPGAIRFSDRRPVLFIVLTLAAAFGGFCVVAIILDLLGWG